MYVGGVIGGNFPPLQLHLWARLDLFVLLRIVGFIRVMCLFFHSVGSGQNNLPPSLLFCFDLETIIGAASSQRGYVTGPGRI